MRDKQIEDLKDYKYGFSTDIESFKAPKGLNEEVIRFISNIKKEPDWLLRWLSLIHISEPTRLR